MVLILLSDIAMSLVTPLSFFSPFLLLSIWLLLKSKVVWTGGLEFTSEAAWWLEQPPEMKNI